MLNWDSQMKKDGGVWSDATDPEKTWYFHVEQKGDDHELIIFLNKKEGRVFDGTYESHEAAKQAAETWFAKNWVW